MEAVEAALGLGFEGYTGGCAWERLSWPAVPSEPGSARDRLRLSPQEGALALKSPQTMTMRGK